MDSRSLTCNLVFLISLAYSSFLETGFLRGCPPRGGRGVVEVLLRFLAATGGGK